MKTMKMTDLITKEQAVKELCRDCDYKPKNDDSCEEICKTYADIMCIEPIKDGDTND